MNPEVQQWLKDHPAVAEELQQKIMEKSKGLVDEMQDTPEQDSEGTEPANE